MRIMTDSAGRDRSRFHRTAIQHAGGSLYVRDFPGCGPAFVLLHGFPVNSRIYDYLIPHLAVAGRRTIAFDFLGFALYRNVDAGFWDDELPRDSGPSQN
jgi:pimeloyl-ACP methyl ester carboxylesterase